MLISAENNEETGPTNNAETSEAVNNDDDGSTVMIEALQDPLLVRIYKGLPELPYATFIPDCSVFLVNSLCF